MSVGKRRAPLRRSPQPPRQPATGGTLNDRMAFIIAMRGAGHTLDDIAAPLGISRERVRQLLEQAGHSGRVPLAPRLDPIALLRFARSPECHSVVDCARKFGVDNHAVHSVLRGIGVAAALKRLYRWRRSAERRRALVAALQQFAAEHGRPPTSVELNDGENGLPWAMVLHNNFGSLGAAYRAAGMKQRPSGGPGHLHPREPQTHCLRGHEFTAENTYVFNQRGRESRMCRACARLRKQQSYRRQRGAA